MFGFRWMQLQVKHGILHRVQPGLVGHTMHGCYWVCPRRTTRWQQPVCVWVQSRHLFAFAWKGKQQRHNQHLWKRGYAGVVRHEWYMYTLQKKAMCECGLQNADPTFGVERRIFSSNYVQNRHDHLSFAGIAQNMG